LQQPQQQQQQQQQQQAEAKQITMAKTGRPKQNRARNTKANKTKHNTMATGNGNVKNQKKNIIKPAKIFAAGIEKCCAIKIAFLC